MAENLNYGHVKLMKKMKCKNCKYFAIEVQTAINDIESLAECTFGKDRQFTRSSDWCSKYNPRFLAHLVPEGTNG